MEYYEKSIFFTAHAFSQVYRCEINGQPIYQPGPCQDPQTTNMRKLDVKPTTASEDLSTPFETVKYHNAETIRIEEDCQNKYPNDARMIRYCVNREREAQGDVDRLKSKGRARRKGKCCRKLERV
jgi:hypothetical protein